ncbi:ankyrin repeat domain-containing protein [Endozoicomonas sp. 8E]|uniref:ankyrin repeat domain-containing protein n=1 Tax=Endozoicomonas sp. 8E TaxID=3035692 RepID=UPI0029394AA0|nr:ankyrin repeat domain-containing protein [Endozoicomonas sp. 8E]WOG28394.1 ankyrin repeat domain-containing protein [Endozoicomonas sp. 8E]
MTDIQQPRLVDVNVSITLDESGAIFLDVTVAIIDPPSQMISQEYNQASATPIADRIIDAPSLAYDAHRSDGGNNFEAQRRPSHDDPDTESQPCKTMKSAAMATSRDRDRLEEFVDRLVKVITNAESTDADIAEAKRLISEYGADEISKCTRSFPVINNLYYSAITPFALACRFGKLDLVKALYVNQEQLDQTFDVVNGACGRTALMLAVVGRHVNVVEQLLTWGANTEIVDGEGNCVDVINRGFSHRDNGVSFPAIKQLLTDYRQERNLPPYIEPGIWFSTIRNPNDTGTSDIQSHNNNNTPSHHIQAIIRTFNHGYR